MAKETTIDDLAVIINKEFEKTNKKIEANHKDLKRDIAEIKLKFAYVAWAIDLEEIKQRVNVLEKKAGIKHQS